jgi:hypothetical protein
LEAHVKKHLLTRGTITPRFFIGHWIINEIKSKGNRKMNKIERITNIEKIKQAKKVVFKGLCLVTGAFILAGCQHHDSNPLLTTNKNEAAQFLYQAQNSASQKTHLYDASGSAYVSCVKNPEHFSNPISPSGNKGCIKFLHAMLNYAKSHQNYKTLTYSDLNNSAVTRRLGSIVLDFQSTGGQKSQVIAIEESTHQMGK